MKMTGKSVVSGLGDLCRVFLLLLETRWVRGAVVFLLRSTSFWSVRRIRQMIGLLIGTAVLSEWILTSQRFVPPDLGSVLERTHRMGLRARLSKSIIYNDSREWRS